MNSVRRLTIASAVLALGGCAAMKFAPAPDRPEAEARSALREMQAAYESGQAEEFLGHFNGGLAGFDAYRNGVRDFLLHNHQITMDIVVDGVVSEAGETSVRAHWNRRFVDASGALRLEEGVCEFIFQARSSGGQALRAIHGRSPF